MRILISGATGLVGSALARALQAADWEVLALRRGPHASRAQEAGTGDIIWSPLTGDIETGRLEGLDAVIHLAGENVAAGRWTQTRHVAGQSSPPLGRNTKKPRQTANTGCTSDDVPLSLAKLASMARSNARRSA